jgi:C4-dicarboxylate-specific signal transduction histidine kinase
LFGNIDTFNDKSFLSTSGIGVGLSSSYKLAKGLGGNLEVTSALKIGT